MRKYHFLSRGTSSHIDRLSSNLSNGFRLGLGLFLKGSFHVPKKMAPSNMCVNSPPLEKWRLRSIGKYTLAPCVLKKDFDRFSIASILG